MLQGSITLVKYAGNNWESIAVTLQIMDITDPYQNNQRRPTDGLVPLYSHLWRMLAGNIPPYIWMKPIHLNQSLKKC